MAEKSIAYGIVPDGTGIVPDGTGIVPDGTPDEGFPQQNERSRDRGEYFTVYSV